MALSRALEVAIIADASKFKRGMDDADKASGRFSKGLGGLAGKIGPLVAGTLSVGALAAGFKSVVGAAKEAEESQSRMQAALKASGISFQDHASTINSVIQKTSELAGIDDEELQNAFTRMVRTTGDVSSALRDVQIAADVARGSHVSLEAATKLVQKAQLGSIGALKRLGVEILPVTKAMDALRASHEDVSAAQVKAAKAADLQATKQAALAALQDKFAGSAKAYGETAAGAQERLSVAFENLQEKIGQKLLPVLAKLTEALLDLITWTERNWPRFQRAFDQAADHVEDAYRKIKPIIDNIRRVIEGLVDIVVGIITGDWARAWDGLGDVAIGALKALANFDKLVGGLFLKAAQALGDKVAEGLEAGLKALGQVMLDALTGLGRVITGQNGTVNGWGRDIGKWLLDATVAALVGLGNAAWGEVQKIGSQITGSISTVAGWGTSIGTKIKESTVAALVGIGTAAWNIIDNIGSTIAGKAADIIAWGAGVGTKVKNGAVTGVTGIATAVWDIVNNIGSTIAGFAGAITEWGSGVGNKVKSGAVSGVTGIATAVWDVVNNIGSTIADNLGAVLNWGRSVGDHVKDGAVDGVTGIATSMWHVIDNIGGVISDNAREIARWGARIGRNIVDGVLDEIGDLGGKIVDKLKGIIGSVAGKIPNPFGDPADSTMTMPTGTAIGKLVGVNLMGADPVMIPFAQAAAAYGLSVTSGLRPGAITAHGTRSDHAIGKAIDVSNGYATPQMAAFFLSLVGNSRVKQAFYDPLGSIFAGVRSSYVEGGHSDHVHVATYDKGGWLQPGLTLARNNTGRPEPVGFGTATRSVTVNVNISGPVYGARKEDVARELAPAIGDALRELDRRRTGGQVLNGTVTLR